MSNNPSFIYVEDNVFNKKECNRIIKKFKPKLDYVLPSGVFATLGEKPYFAKKFYEVLVKYQKTYPHIHYTPSKWQLGNFKFHFYKNGKSFDEWHNEHCMSQPHRILGMILYLTEHQTGTEFLSGGYIQSKIGRVAAFPSGFTHTHRGQVCPEKKDRFIISAYVSFFEKGVKEIEWVKKNER